MKSHSIIIAEGKTYFAFYIERLSPYRNTYLIYYTDT